MCCHPPVKVSRLTSRPSVTFPFPLSLFPILLFPPCVLASEVSHPLFFLHPVLAVFVRLRDPSTFVDEFFEPAPSRPHQTYCTFQTGHGPFFPRNKQSAFGIFFSSRLVVECQALWGPLRFFSTCINHRRVLSFFLTQGLAPTGTTFFTFFFPPLELVGGSPLRARRIALVSRPAPNPPFLFFLSSFFPPLFVFFPLQASLPRNVGVCPCARRTSFMIV